MREIDDALFDLAWFGCAPWAFVSGIVDEGLRRVRMVFSRVPHYPTRRNP
jgi:hypothetical protein